MSPAKRLRLSLILCAAAMVSAAPGRAATMRLMVGTDGPDVIATGPAPAHVIGHEGDDKLTGGPGADWLDGNGGADTLDGGGGDDTLHGGRGDDRLIGGAGDDLLAGDVGEDILTGGSGADRFVLAPGGGHDVVTDFSAAEGDRILVQGLWPPVIASDAEGAIVRLSDGSELRLTGVAAAGLDRALVRAEASAPKAAPAAPARSPWSPALPILLAVIAAVAGLIVWLARRRRPGRSG
jgi:hypothetical protein